MLRALAPGLHVLEPRPGAPAEAPLLGAPRCDEVLRDAYAFPLGRA